MTAKPAVITADWRGVRRNIDIIPLTADLALYKLIAAPNLCLIDDDAVSRVEKFVAGEAVRLCSTIARDPQCG